MEDFYKTIYGGKCLEGEALREYLARAQEQLALYKRIYTVSEPSPDAGSYAVCAMAEAMHYFDTAQNGLGGMRYASVGTVSVSGKGIYSAVDISPKAQSRELYRCAATYLDIYRRSPC